MFVFSGTKGITTNLVGVDNKVLILLCCVCDERVSLEVFELHSPNMCAPGGAWHHWSRELQLTIQKGRNCMSLYVFCLCVALKSYTRRVLKGALVRRQVHVCIVEEETRK